MLRELKSDLVNPSMRLSDILRKAKVLAYQLQSEEMKSWINLELDEYNHVPNELIPNYRKINTQSFGYFTGSFGAELRNAPIAPASLPDVPKEYITVYLVRHGIRGVEALIAENDISHKFLWPQNNVMGIGNRVYIDYHCVQAWWLVNKYQLEQLLDVVRNRLLTFVLEIEKQNILICENDQITLKPMNNVSQVFNTFILGDNTVIGVGRDLMQNDIQNIVVGDLPSLSQALLAFGLEKSDIVQLEEAIKADDVPLESKSFSGKVKQWLGGIIRKASSGVWKISLDVATNMLTQALFKYYGWN